MRLVALSVLLIGNLFAHQVLAEDVIPQPLTRGDCGKAGMAWDDNANVCRAASLAAEPVPEAEGAQTVTDTVVQPAVGWHGLGRQCQCLRSSVSSCRASARG